MCAIYKKELRAYLTSMTGYIFMAVLLAVTSLYYVANCLVGGYPGLRSCSLLCLFCTADYCAGSDHAEYG